MSNHMSYGDVARALNTTLARAKGMLTGLEPDIRVGNGRIVLFEEDRVKVHLAAENADLLSFLGYLSLETSYDVVTSE
jgi:hypothetical protein